MARGRAWRARYGGQGDGGRGKFNRTRGKLVLADAGSRLSLRPDWRRTAILGFKTRVLLLARKGKSADQRATLPFNRAAKQQIQDAGRRTTTTAREHTDGTLHLPVVEPDGHRLCLQDVDRGSQGHRRLIIDSPLGAHSVAKRAPGDRAVPHMRPAPRPPLCPRHRYDRPDAPHSTDGP